MLGFGLTVTSSTYGGLFYLIIGAHGVHVLGALIALAYTWMRMTSGQEQPLTQGGASAVRMLWYFVVGVWPILYVLVYLA
jgi:cytochrome c oxidase subunit 3